MLTDALDRPLSTLRLSVTDRCNLRCTYCMPEANYRWLDKKHLLTFEELTRVVKVLQVLGLRRVRITGGEPLLRQELPVLVKHLDQLGLPHLAMTTNGILLSALAESLRSAGLHRITVSLDTLRPETFLQISQRNDLSAVLSGLSHVKQLGYEEVKLDTVLVRGVNDSELIDLLEYAAQLPAEIRFIEYMDVGGATGWRRDLVVSQEEILRRVAARYGSYAPLEGRGHAPAERFQLPGGQVFGVVASVTKPFCQNCDRLRLTADGQLLTCLYAKTGFDLRHSLRNGDSDSDLIQRLSECWSQRRDQAAVERARLSQRTSYLSLDELRANPRLEMHTRGG